jgi:hypothetical protein
MRILPVGEFDVSGRRLEVLTGATGRNPGREGEGREILGGLG